MKKILITGKSSYIGNSFEEWMKNEPKKYSVDKISLKNDSWKEKNFEQYDVILHVAGIAHSSSNKKLEDVYYKVNRDLTIEIAKKAKSEGVKQFLFMSSIIVYGDGSSKKRLIAKNTIPIPSNFYGSSKLQAEEGIKPLKSESFKVCIIRPPMIYGKGSGGNYPRLANLAQKTPIFPNYGNERSMLHIDNLCELLKVLIDYEESGLFFPQNKEYVKTSEMVQMIGEIHGKKVKLTKVFNPLIKLLFHLKFVNKVFGNLAYEKSLSDFEKSDYQIRTLEESIKLTER